MKKFSEVELNLMSIDDLDRQIMSGNLQPVCINDGRIIGTDDEN